MHKNPLITFALGIMIGLTLGYVLGERQSIPPKPLADQMSQTVAAEIPEGHPQLAQGAAGSVEIQRLRAHASALEHQIDKDPANPRLTAALGNLYFDGGQWADARTWYERSLEIDGHNPDVLVDLAVVERNLRNPEKALGLLDRALAQSPDHWQALYNKAALLGTDLGRRGDAAEVLDRLKGLRATNPAIPDLTNLETQIAGS